ncbi:MAG TPA: SUMF1/EgtB/PvdO family nonheme iron enzyme [Polyangiaceae bacterium]
MGIRTGIAIACLSFGPLVFAACGSDDTASTVDDDDASTDTDAMPSGSDASARDGAVVIVDAGPDTGCPIEMSRIGDFCVDRWEAYVVEIDDAGTESPHSPFDFVPDGVHVRAKSAGGVSPQGYISQIQATEACTNAGKRLCSPDEFSQSCRGVHADASTPYYPYGGTTHEPGVCNEGKGSSVEKFYGSDPSKWTYADFNDPQLNQWDGGLAKTGEYTGCVSEAGTYDCVGNLHEWTNEPADAKGHGRFHGGFYGDAEFNGHGCLYVTSAHELAYHDYSTGFRCCKDAEPRDE